MFPTTSAHAPLPHSTLEINPIDRHNPSKIKEVWDRATISIEETLNGIHDALEQKEKSDMDLTLSVDILKKSVQAIEKLYALVMETLDSNSQEKCCNQPVSKVKSFCLISASVFSFAVGLGSLALENMREKDQEDNTLKWMAFGFCVAGLALARTSAHFRKVAKKDENDIKILQNLTNKAVIIKNTKAAIKAYGGFKDIPLADRELRRNDLLLLLPNLGTSSQATSIDVASEVESRPSSYPFAIEEKASDSTSGATKLVKP